MINVNDNDINSNSIEKREFYEEIRDNKYIYAYTTFERAFPYHKDGLKFITRCIIYEFIRNNITKNTVKSAKVVGGIIGNLSPHGDAATYGAAAAMVPSYNNNHPLVQGQGSFATITNDAPASARYTEMKLSQFAIDIIDDINKYTVDHEPNFDNTIEIPIYIPFKVPVLLLNGSQGIGDGFAQNMPLHNISDVVDICKKYIMNKNIKNEDLVDGFFPDFPNYGVITNKSEIERYYKYGEKSTVKMKSNIDIDRENHRIFIRDLPYNMKRNDVIDTIRKYNEQKHVIMSKIYDLIDIKTTRDGEMHYEFEIKYDEKNSNLLEISNELTKKCLTTSSPLNFMLYYGDNVKSVNIKTIIEEWYKIRYSTIRRKFNYKIINLQRRVHVLEGILIIYDHIDEVINFIKTSKSKEDIVSFLVNRFKSNNLTEIQAKSISEMQLFELSKVSKDSLIGKINKIYEEIELLNNDLFNIDNIIIDELDYIKNKYQRPRRTILMDEDSESKNVDSIIMSSGAILHSLNQYVIFDLQNLVNGKTLLNGLKSVKIDGKNVKEIKGVKEIRDNISGLFIIYENGTARKIEPQEIGYTNNWINHPVNNTFIKFMLPIYTDNDFIIEMTDDLKVKLFNPNMFTKSISNHNNIIACDNLKVTDNAVLICDEKDNYVAYYIDDIPEVQSKTGLGVKTAFTDKDIKYHIKSFNTESEKKLVFTVVDTENNINIITKDFNDLVLSHRPGKLRNILEIDPEEYTIISINVVDIAKKNTKCIMIGNGSSSTLKINNFRNLDDTMKKINTDTKCIIQFSDE